MTGLNSGLRHFSRKVGLFGGFAVVFAPTIALAQSASAGDGTKPASVEEVIVTAQRRAQSLQQVPVAVTALTQDVLQANRIVDVRDLNAIAPNLTVRTTAGGNNAPYYTIRGLLSQGISIGNDKGVAVYIDGVFMQTVMGSIFQLADVERIEVLKGPQGTLFGRNATGGAVSFTTRDPSGEFGVEQTLTYGNYRQFRSKTRVDLPANGPLSGSLVYIHDERDGDVRNLGAGTRWNYGPATGGALGVRTSPERLGDNNTDALALALRLEANDSLTFSYKFDYADTKYTPEAWGLLQLLPLYALVVPTQPNPANLTPVSLRRPDSVNNAFSTANDSLMRGHNLTASWQVNENISVKNILAYRQYSILTSQQFDGSGGLVRAGVPLVLSAGAIIERGHQWSDEIIVDIDTRRMHLTAGYLYFDSSQTRGIPGIPASTPFASTFPNFTLPVGPFGVVRADIKSHAFFAQPELHITDKLDLVVGYRLTMDRKKENNRYDLTRPFRVAKYSKDKPTWLAGINYKVNDDLFVYGKYATGYISGGTILGVYYSPELSKSWEAGVKADLFDRRLRSNLAVYSVKYSGVQQLAQATRLIPPRTDLGNAFVTANGGDAKAKGFEWENTLVPIDGLTLTANLGYTDFKWTSLSPVLPVFTYGSYRPKWTGNVAAQYEVRDMPGRSRLVLRVDGVHKSRFHMDPVSVSPAVDAAMTVGATWIVNARVALRDIQLKRGSAEVALWARNLANDDHPSFAGNFGVLLAASYERARTYGVDLSFKY